MTKKLVNRLQNVVSFYEMYADKRLETGDERQEKSQNPIDQWIEARLNDLEARLIAGEQERAELAERLDFTERMVLEAKDRPKGLPR